MPAARGPRRTAPCGSRIRIRRAVRHWPVLLVACMQPTPVGLADQDSTSSLSAFTAASNVCAAMANPSSLSDRGRAHAGTCPSAHGPPGPRVSCGTFHQFQAIHRPDIPLLYIRACRGARVAHRAPVLLHLSRHKRGDAHHHDEAGCRVLRSSLRSSSVPVRWGTAYRRSASEWHF